MFVNEHFQRRFCVLGQYYRMAGPKELELFLEDPEKYAPLEPKKLPPPPNRRPHRRTAAEVKALAPKPVEFAGYCPVTYLDGGKRFDDEFFRMFSSDLY